MRIIVLAYLSAVGLTAPAVAAQDQPAVSAAPAKANDGDKKVCRKVKTTGSRLGGTTECRTKREWEELSRAVQNDMRTMPQNTGY